MKNPNKYFHLPYCMVGERAGEKRFCHVDIEVTFEDEMSNPDTITFVMGLFASMLTDAVEWKESEANNETDRC